MELKTIELTKDYGKKRALDGFSYTFEPGIYGLLGPNGAGKSTLMGILTTGLKATGGKVTWDGTDIASIDDRVILPNGDKAKVSMLFFPQGRKATATAYKGEQAAFVLLCVRNNKKLDEGMIISKVEK